MISKRVISEIRALHLDKNRKERQLFIAEGEKVVSELIRSNLKIELIAGTGNYFDAFPPNQSEMEFYQISESDLFKISMLRTPNKVIAVAAIPEPLPVDFSKDTGLILLLDGINDPGNLGTLIRTADWFGIKQVFCSENCVDAYNPKVVQSAMGSLFRTSIHYGRLEDIIAEGKASGGYKVAGAAANGVPYQQCRLDGPLMLLIGSESHGISKDLVNLLDVKTGIPRAPDSEAESLNAGIAGAILLAHFQGHAK